MVFSLIGLISVSIPLIKDYIKGRRNKPKDIATIIPILIDKFPDHWTFGQYEDREFLEFEKDGDILITIYHDDVNLEIEVNVKINDKKNKLFIKRCRELSQSFNRLKRLKHKEETKVNKQLEENISRELNRRIHLTL